VILFTPRPFCLWETTRYSANRRLSWGGFGEEKNNLTLLGLEHWPSNLSLDAIMTTLFRYLKGSKYKGILRKKGVGRWYEHDARKPFGLKTNK